MNNKKIYSKDKDNENYDNFENKYNCNFSKHYNGNHPIWEQRRGFYNSGNNDNDHLSIIPLL